MARDGRPDLAAILRTHGAAYLASHPRPNRTQMKAWRAIVACRTAVLGAHVTQCDACGVRRHVYSHCQFRYERKRRGGWVAGGRDSGTPEDPLAQAERSAADGELSAASGRLPS